MGSKFFKCLYSNNINVIKITSIPNINSLRCFHTSKQNLGAVADPKSKDASSKCNNKQEENLVAVLYKKEDLRIETKPIPKFNPDQVLIQIEAVGIGESDANIFQNSTTTKPITIGHEASGIIVECGKNVKTLKPGDKVAIEPYIGCKKCYACKTGNYNLCKRIKQCGHPPLDGVLCRYYAYDADSCHKLPSNFDFEQGCLLQPLSLVMHAMQRVNLTEGDIVLVSGAGLLGLLGIILAKACVPSVIVIDKNDYNLKKAMTLGPRCAINVKGIKPRDVRNRVAEVIGKLPNKALDCSCDEEMIQSSMHTIRSGGQVVLLGLGKENMKLPLQECYWRMTNVIGSCRSCNDYPRSIHVINSKEVDIKCLVTHHFKLEECVKAFKLACKKTEPFLKIMVHCNPEWRPTC